jgi:hypothetical protein
LGAPWAFVLRITRALKDLEMNESVFHNTAPVQMVTLMERLFHHWQIPILQAQRLLGK